MSSTDRIEPVGVSRAVRPTQKVERRRDDEREDPNRHKRRRDRKPEQPPVGDGAPHIDVLA
jgi:hypothetical protein